MQVEKLSNNNVQNCMFPKKIYILIKIQTAVMISAKLTNLTN